jgi:hypothetical protein
VRVIRGRHRKGREVSLSQQGSRSFVAHRFVGFVGEIVL